MLIKSKVRDWLKDTGGYSIVDPQHFLDMGMDPKTVNRITSTFSDDPELGKHRATRDDGKSGPVHGVDEFTAVEAVADELGAEVCAMYRGRGMNFNETVANIFDKIGRP